MVSTIDFPPIESLGRKYLIKWKEKRDEYDKAMREHSKATGVPVKVHNKKWIDSIKRSLLETVCTLKWNIDVDGLKENEFQRRLMEIMSERPKDYTHSSEDYIAFFKELKIGHVVEDDVFEVVANFITDVSEIIKAHALQEDMTLKGPRRIILSTITDRLEPVQLREKMRDMLRIHKFDSLCAYAKPLEKHLTTLMEAKKFSSPFEEGAKRKDREDDETERDAVKARKLLDEGKEPFQGEKDDSPAAPEPGDPPGGAAKKGGAKDKTCWACKEKGHTVHECPTVKDEDEKGKIIRETLKKNKTFRAMAGASATHLLTLGSKLQVPYCPDTGADLNIIPRSMVDKLSAVCPNIRVKPLATPIHCMGCNGNGFTAKDSVDIKLQIQTAAGPVNIPGAQTCYVVDDGEEFLLSNATLKSIGIDIDRLLEQLAARQFDDDGHDLATDDDDDACARVPPRPTSGTSGVPVVPVSTTAETRRVVDARASEAVVGRLPFEAVAGLKISIDEATAQGFPAEMRNRLWRIVTKHDVWRTAFDPRDPPAMVAQFGIKLVPQKAQFFYTEVKWCGRTLNADGVKHDPDRIKARCDIPYPMNAGESQQVIFAPDKEWKAYPRGKMALWAGIMGAFRYVIEHIDGIHNLWTDMMSRWGHRGPATRNSAEQVPSGLIYKNYPISSASSD
ncbi:hypothetical protein SDRG_17367 [Saprolegnia diclina VS20]|nr:hypothetical protein SDRG_17367 [Saprolegnia diclina VS20]EQC24740.1 hypothetical protein SDRG_17367 [Saprolegnia diclina VS20]|eukprot:XP_008621831.1 hypothetical protein SDRG_17367 [Saprolegnia diclina VS20]